MNQEVKSAYTVYMYEHPYNIRQYQNHKTMDLYYNRWFIILPDDEIYPYLI